MRNDHHGKNNKLVKRAFALCLALAVICSCLLPVFATEGGWIATQELNASTQVATMDTAFGVDDGYGIDTQETDAAASTSQSGAVAAQPGISTGGGIATGGISRPVTGGVVTDPVVDSGSTSDSASSGSTSASTSASTSTSESTASSTTGTSEVITDPSTITDVKIPDGATNIVKNANGSYSYTTEYGRITVFPTKEGEKTTWKDDEVTITPNPNLKEDDAAFGVLPIEYHFWLKQLDSDTFRELDWEAQMAEMSETEYLALFGASEKFPIWHMDTIASTDTISNYKFANPTSKDDPAGEGREFAYWYTVDENGVESEFNPYNTYGSETATIVNVYAKWKDASGDVVNEDTTKEETTTSGETKTNPVEVSAKANIPDYDGEVTVTVTGLPSNVTHLSVTSMGENSMQSFYELYSSKNKNSTMAPLLGYKIAPKDANNETVQPKGPVTVTISGLPEEIMLSELAPFKVLHQVTDYDIETINASYSNGTLTFATDSFSPFVIASKGGYGVSTLEGNDDTKVINVNETVQLKGTTGYSNNSWWSSDNSIVELQGQASDSRNAVGKKAGTATVTHQYWNGYWRSEETFTIIVNGTDSAAVYFLFDTEKYANKNDVTEWAGVLTYNGSNATVDTTNATWENGSNDNSVLYYKNIKTNVSSYITTWPDGKTGSQPWVLDETARTTKVSNTQNNVTTTKTVEQFVFENYQKKLKELELPDDILSKLTAKDITITLVPYKISRSNGTNPDKHIDCNVVVTCDKTFTAKFHVKKPGENYEEVSSKVYLDNQKVQKYVGAEAPETITDENGVIWKFDGWYPENEAGDGPNEVDGVILDTDWPYTVAQWQLENHNKDRVVNFYAHYTPVSANLTVTKTVTGKLGDTNKAFTFQILDANNNPVKLTNGSYEFSNTNGALLNEGTEGKFTLKDGASITFKNLPSGEYKVVEDDYSGEKYETSYVIDSGTPTGGREANVTIGTDAMTIDFTNHCTLPPDLGILLDTLPYIVILAVVAGGGVLLMLRKRRKNDD